MSAGHHSKEAYCDTMLMPLKSDSSPHLSYTSSGVEGEKKDQDLLCKFSIPFPGVTPSTVTRRANVMHF